MQNNCKDNDRKTKRGEDQIKPELFYDFHAEEHNGFLRDCSMTLIDKSDSLDRKRCEENWFTVIKTVAPDGLNRIEQAF